MRHRSTQQSYLDWFWFLLTLGSFIGVHSSSATADITMTSKGEATTNENGVNSLAVVFSDLDGTLIHYPSDPDKLVQANDGRGILQLPPSATGMKGVISSKTLNLCRDVRQSGTKLVFISGMRASTLVKRLPYLPRADAYCCEAGGRIFYPLPLHESAKANNEVLQIRPVAYDDAHPEDLEPFTLVEDSEWRKEMESMGAAGPDGFVGDNTITPSNEKEVPVEKRQGALWKHARTLMKQGYVLDTTGYSCCFRVNRKHQSSDTLFDSLLKGNVASPPELGTSTNLGCIDFYPVASGKKNCCDYLAKKFVPNEVEPLSKRCVCLCDDDNDVDMALACAHAYIPMVSSDSMAATIRAHRDKFTVTSTEEEGDNADHTLATEAALLRVLERIQSNK